MRIAVVLVLSALGFIAEVSAATKVDKRAPVIRRTAKLSAVEEAQQKFTFAGRPIHPKAVHLLLGNLADSQPVVVAVDVGAAATSNDYLADGVEVEQDVVRYSNDTESVGYVRLGTLTNGVVVLRAWESGGGSGVFESLLCVRFERFAGRPGQKGERLIMRTAGIASLGDRTDEKVQLLPDRVIVGKPGTKEVRVLRF